MACTNVRLYTPSPNVPYAPPRQGAQDRAHVKVYCAARPNPGRQRVQPEPEARRPAQISSQQPSDHCSDCRATASFRLPSANKSGYTSAPSAAGCVLTVGRTHLLTSQPRRGFFAAFRFELSAYVLDGCVVPPQTLDAHRSFLRLVKAAGDLRGSIWDVLHGDVEEVRQLQLWAELGAW